jgi:hypothetical protein
MNIAATMSRKTITGARIYRTIGSGERCSNVPKIHANRPKRYLRAEKTLDMYGRILDIGEVISDGWAPNPSVDEAASVALRSVVDIVAWRSEQRELCKRVVGYISN